MRLLALAAALAFAPFSRAQLENPDVNAASAIVMDADTGQILFFKNKDVRRFPASTTKIMTGMLLAEHCQPEDVVTAPTDVKKTRESSMHLEPGERLSMRDLLYAMMLRSANDGCHTVAVHLAGSEAKFAEMMNERAKQIGCQNTNFVNPHGLHNPNHYTTAYDLALMGREAMKVPLFAQVVGTQKYVVARSLNQKDTLMVNRDKWLALEPAAIGIKTGWTRPAGHCFVGCMAKDGLRVVTVVMDSSDWLFDQQVLTAWTLDNFEKRTLCSKGDVVATATVEGGEESAVQLEATEDVSALAPFDQEPTWSIPAGQIPTLKAPVETDMPIKVKIEAANGIAKELTVVPKRRVAKKVVPATVLYSASGAMGVVLLGGGAILVRARSRRMAQEFSLR